MGLLDDSYISFVNLEHRKDRLESITSQLNRFGIKATRTPGIYSYERTEEKSVMTKMLSRPQVGALGCFLAQMDIMKEALRQKKHAWVMEDDIILCEDYLERIAYLDKWIEEEGVEEEGLFDWGTSWFVQHPKEFDVLWMGATFHVNPPWHHKDTLGRDAETTSNPRILKTYGSFNTYNYIVHRDSVEHVLQLLESTLPTSIGIDASFITLSPNLETYAFVPGCSKQMDNESDQYPGAYTKFSGFFKLGPYVYQERMEDFDPTTYNWAECTR